jgi:hypothetical protein
MTREKYAEIDDAIRATLEATTTLARALDPFRTEITIGNDLEHAEDRARAALGAILRARVAA